MTVWEKEENGKNWVGCCTTRDRIGAEEMERATECRLSHAPFRLRLVKRLIETDRQAQTEKSEREASLSSVTLNNRTVSSSFQSKVVPPPPYRLVHSSLSHSTREFQLFIGTKKEGKTSFPSLLEWSAGSCHGAVSSFDKIQTRETLRCFQFNL